MKKQLPKASSLPKWQLLGNILLEILIICLFAVVVSYKFWPVLTGAKHFVHPGDTADLIYSDDVFAARSLKTGNFPLWNPHQFGGVPFSSYPQVGLFYPLNWVFWLLPYGDHPFPPEAYQYLVIFHVWLGGWLMYLASRGMKLSRTVSILAGLSYSLMPNVLLYIGWGSQITSFAWFPLLVLGLYKTLVDGQTVHAYFTGLILGILMLAAPAQPAIMAMLLTGFFIACYSLYLLFFQRHNWLHSLLPTFVSSCIIFLIGFAIASPSLLPITQFAPRTMRFLGVDGDIVGKQKLPMHALLHDRSVPEDLWGFVLPDKAGTPMGFNYYGLLPLLGALFAICTLTFRKPVVFFGLFLAVFSTIYAQGKIFPFIFYHLPFLNLVREPNKYLLFVSIVISFLFAYGLQAAWKFALKNGWVWKVTGALSILLLIIFYWQKSTGVPYEQLLIVGMGLGIFTLAQLGKKLILTSVFAIIATTVLLVYDFHFFQLDIITNERFAVKEYLTSQDALLELKPAENDNYRIAGVESAEGWPYAFDAGSYLGLYDVFGYGNPVYFPFMDYRSRNGYCGKFYDLLNTKYFITYDSSQERLTDCGGTNKQAAIALELFHINYKTLPVNQLVKLHVYENTNRLGPAHLVGSVKLVPENKDPIGFINDNVEIATEAALVKREDFEEVSKALSNEQTDTTIKESAVHLVSHTSDTVQLTVESSRSALLVSSDLYYSGWVASIDSQSTPVYETNYIFRSILVPPGKHAVTFRYQPPAVFTGVKLAILALLLVTSNYFFVFISKKPTPKWWENIMLAVFLLMLGVILINYIEFNQFNLKRYDLPH